MYNILNFSEIDRFQWLLPNIFCLKSFQKWLYRFKWNLTESKYSTCSTKFVHVLLGSVCPQRWHPSFWLTYMFQTFPLQLINAFQQNLTGSNRNVFYQVCISQADLSSKIAPWLLIDWEIFSLCSVTSQWIWRKLGRKQVLDVPFKFVLFCQTVKARLPPWSMISLCVIW